LIHVPIDEWCTCKTLQFIQGIFWKMSLLETDYWIDIEEDVRLGQNGDQSHFTWLRMMMMWLVTLSHFTTS
jgi:hypothetical protein